MKVVHEPSPSTGPIKRACASAPRALLPLRPETASTVSWQLLCRLPRGSGGSSMDYGEPFGSVARSVLIALADGAATATAFLTGRRPRRDRRLRRRDRPHSSCSRIAHRIRGGSRREDEHSCNSGTVGLGHCRIDHPIARGPRSQVRRPRRASDCHRPSQVGHTSSTATPLSSAGSECVFTASMRPRWTSVAARPLNPTSSR